MNVLYIIDQGTVGGAIHSFMEMVVALKQLGVQPIVVTSLHNDVNDYLDNNGIENVASGHKAMLNPFSWKSIKGPIFLVRKYFSYKSGEAKALRVLEEKIDFSKIDLIHTNSARCDLGCLINQKYGIPHVMHIREYADLDFNCISFRRRYISFYNNYTTKFISISNSVKEHWVKKGIKRDKISTIYNGINFVDISESSDQEKRSDVIKMVIAGGVYKTKGQHLAVEAMTLLPEPIKRKFTLDIIGWYGKRYIPAFMKVARNNGIESQVRILGSRDDVHQLLGNYHIGLMCSKSEGFGRVTAEYMHAQLGVIVSDSGANPELIQDGINGLMFKSGNAESLSKCLIRLFNDRDLLIRLSHAAKEKARKTYTQEMNAAAIFKMYQEILK